MADDGIIDWDLAVATAVRLAGAGPAVSRAEADSVVASLARMAIPAEQHVREFTGLAPTTDLAPAEVVDRAGWVRANVAGFRTVITPLLDRLADRAGVPAAGTTRVASARLAGAQTGAVLALVAGKVLGQYEVLAPVPRGTGRLLLVAPNIVDAERRLGVIPRDFRMWVTLHEVTHRTQFTAVPWLRGHMLAEIGAYLDTADVDASALLRRLGGLLRSAGDVARGRTSIVEAVHTPQQRVVLDRLTGVMSLLEGHAEHVMDGVGPDVVPSVAVIRERFERRRADPSPADRLLRRMLGLDLKLRQYADGRAFVERVVARVGREGFNAVWHSPDRLPSREEIQQPDTWVARVHPRVGTGGQP